MPVELQAKFYDVLGSDQTTPHMSVAWSWAFDTPFKWTKQVASFFGGTRNGMVMSWPGHIKDAGGIRSQFHHVIDIVPTILEAAGITAPEMVDGIKQKPIEGVSMSYTFDNSNAKAPSKRDTQYFEMFGNRALYHDGWIAATVPPQPPWLMGTAKMPDLLTGYKWELYNIADDYSENNDLAAKNPDKLKELQDLFMVEARKYQVLPLDNSILERILTPRPSATAGRNEFTYYGEVSGIPSGSAPNPLTRSYSITAEVEVPAGGGEGMLNTVASTPRGRTSPTRDACASARDRRASSTCRGPSTSRSSSATSCDPASASKGSVAGTASFRWTAKKLITKKSHTRSRLS